MLSPFDDEIIVPHDSGRLDRYQTPQTYSGGAGAPIVYAGNLATVTVRADEPPTNQNTKAPDTQSTSSLLLWVGIGAIVLLLIKR